MGNVDAVIMVGGSSLVPLVKTKILELFSNNVKKVLFHEPMKAIAGGAAMHVCQLDGKAERFKIPPELKGVSGYNIGIRSIDSSSGKIKIDTLVKKNLPLPLSVTKTYYTTREAQDKMLLDFVQFIDKTSVPINLGKLKIDLDPDTTQNYPVEVTVENNINGTVNVRAFDPRSGRELKQSFGIENRESSYLFSQKALVNNIRINNLF